MNDARPGCLVQFKGLNGAAHLNGQEGRLVRWFKRVGILLICLLRMTHDARLSSSRLNLHSLMQ